MPTPLPLALPRMPAALPVELATPASQPIAQGPVAKTGQNGSSWRARLSEWNRNERASLTILGTALLLAVFVVDRSPVSLIGALMLLGAGLLPAPPLARGLLALAGGLGPLVHLLGAWSIALPLLPAALLTRARLPTSKIARYLAIAGTVALALAYVLSREGVQPIQLIFGNLKAGFAGWLRALYWILPLPLGVLALLAVLRGRKHAEYPLWATLALLWLPVGMLLAALWNGSMLAGIFGGLGILASSTGTALGLAGLAALEGIRSSASAAETTVPSA